MKDSSENSAKGKPFGLIYGCPLTFHGDDRTYEIAKKWVDPIKESARLEAFEECRQEIVRILGIQYSGARPEIEFERGYTTAYENMKAFLLTKEKKYEGLI